MRMRENDRIDGIRGHGQVLPVALAPFLLSLEKAAIEQYSPNCERPLSPHGPGALTR